MFWNSALRPDRYDELQHSDHAMPIFLQITLTSVAPHSRFNEFMHMSVGSITATLVMVNLGPVPYVESCRVIV